LEKVLLEAYGTPSVSDLSPISDVGAALHDISGHPVVSAEAAPDSSVSAMSAPVEVPNRSRIGQFSALLALPAGAAAYFAWRRTKKRPNPEPVYPALSLGVSDVLV